MLSPALFWPHQTIQGFWKKFANICEKTYQFRLHRSTIKMNNFIFLHLLQLFEVTFGSVSVINSIELPTYTVSHVTESIGILFLCVGTFLIMSFVLLCFYRLLKRFFKKRNTKRGDVENSQELEKGTELIEATNEKNGENEKFDQIQLK